MTENISHLLMLQSIPRYICFAHVILELKNLVLTGIFDERMKTQLQVRVIACLGDNLEQNNIAGLRHSLYIRTKSS